ncbi:MAG: hypothetical protein RIA08_08065 [Roseovarius sp.]|uniref:hypothetical protein n=1 Tax=Roseovarius sp. TaxID=1486281 RepID=UPI0032EB0501
MKQFTKITGSCILSYLTVAIVLFGGPLQPIGFITFWNDRLAVANWPVFLATGSILGLMCAAFSTRLGVALRYTPAIFIFFSIVCSTIMLGLYTEHRRSEVIEKFAPDVAIRASFFESIRSSPREFQMFLHGAALKDCIPYAWSYRDMAFYQLPANVTVNVLPLSWVKECQITRDR